MFAGKMVTPRIEAIENLTRWLQAAESEHHKPENQKTNWPEFYAEFIVSHFGTSLTVNHGFVNPGPDHFNGLAPAFIGEPVKTWPEVERRDGTIIQIQPPYVDRRKRVLSECELATINKPWADGSV